MAVNKSVNLAAKVLGSILNLRAMGVFEGAQRASANTPIARGAGDLGVQRAARFFYLQKLGFGGKVDGQTFGVATTSKARLNLLRLEEDLSQVHLRLHQVTIEHMDWAACVERYDRPHTLFYLDTPYYGTEGYGVDFGLDQYGRMAELLHTMQGKAPVSVNDIPHMRLAFKGLAMRRLSINYTVGASGRGREPKGELLIANFPLE